MIEFLNALVKLINSTRQCAEHKCIPIHRVKPRSWPFLCFLPAFLCQLYNSYKNDWISKCFGQYDQLNRTMCRAQHLSKCLQLNLSCDHFLWVIHLQFPVCYPFLWPFLCIIMPPQVFIFHEMRIGGIGGDIRFLIKHLNIFLA